MTARDDEASIPLHASNNPQRLEALVSYAILDTPPERGYDDIVLLASQICETPVALVSLVVDDRQWFKAKVGFGPSQTPIAQSVCAYALQEPELLVIPDLSADPRTSRNTLVTDGPQIRFYAGAPLVTPDGIPLGSLCVIDTAPRPQGLTPDQRTALAALGRQVMAHMELRRSLAARDAALHELGESEGRHRQILESAVDYAIITMDLKGDVTGWNGGAEHVLGWSEAEMRGKPADVFFTPEDHAANLPEKEMASAREHGRGSDERWHVRKDGTRFYALGEMMTLRSEAGAHVGYLKILRDRTSHREVEDRSRRIEEALAESEERQRLAVEATGIGVFDYMPDSGALRWDARLRELFGVRPDEAVTYERSFLAGLHPDDRERTDEAVRAALDPAGPGVFDIEYRVCALDDGTERWLAARGKSTFDGSRPVRFVGTVIDITEQRQARDALARSEERYRTLFEAIDDGFCIIEFFDGPHGPLSDYVHVEANPGYERQTGIENIVGRTVRDLAPSEADGWVELYGGVLQTGKPIRFERYFAAAGRHIEVSAARVEPASLRQVSVLFRNIAERKRAEAALQTSEALARENVQRVQLALAAGAIIGTWAWDLPTDRFTVDEAFARAFGLDPDLGRDGLSLAQVVETVHPDDQAGLAAAMDAAIKNGGAYAHQYRVRRRDGNYYWLEANGRVDHAPDGTPLGFPGVLIDVEERRAIIEERDRAASALRALNETLEQRIAERTAELIRAEEQLRQSQKMEAVGQLTGGIAHDFNNLLAGISGSLELMQTRMSQGRFTELDRYMSAAQGAAKRAAALTHRLLAFSRRQTLDPRPTDMNRLVAGMEELIRRTVGPAITLEAVAAGGLWATLVDPPQLENALLNLCINARDAMPDGGRLTIETGNRWLDRRAAAERDLPPGQYVSLCVSDTGTGMTPHVIAKAFDPFFTTKPIGQGTGLGLSMIYGFARQSGGQVRIYSEPEQGSMVCIYLPRLVGSADAVEALPELADAPRAGDGETVLVVDDEPTVRMLVTEVLQELGYAAIEAADGPSGLRVLQSDTRVDLLVTDVGLPGGMNGRQMADAARISRPDLKVLFITGYAENAAVGNGHLERGMHVLTKPFPMEALAIRIKELIAD